MDYGSVFRKYPNVALHLQRGWALQSARGEPFTWGEIQVFPRTLTQYSAAGFVRAASTAYRFVDRQSVTDRLIQRAAGAGATALAVQFVEDSLDYYDTLANGVSKELGRGLLVRRSGGFAVAEADPHAERWTRIFDSAVERGMLTKEPTSYWVNVDRDPTLRAELAGFLTKEYPVLQARQEEAARAEQLRVADARARHEAAQRHEEEERFLREEDLRIRENGTLMELAAHFPINDELLALGIRRGFTHHAMARAWGVGMSRLTRVRRQLGLQGKRRPRKGTRPSWG